MTYKLRAECLHDINVLIRSLPCSKFKIECARIPDCTFEFESTYTLDETKILLIRIPDGHVMAETVNTIAEYTGERGAK